MEKSNKVERSELWNEIYNIVKQIPRKDVEGDVGDVVDAPSATTSIEEMLIKIKYMIAKADTDTKRALLLISEYINNPCRIGKLDMDVTSYTTDDRQKMIVHSITLFYRQVVVMKATVTTTTVSTVVDYTWLKDGKWQEDFIESMRFYPMLSSRKFSIEEELKTLNGYKYE